MKKKIFLAVLSFMLFEYGVYADDPTIYVTYVGTYEGRTLVKTNKSNTSLRYVENNKRFRINGNTYRTISGSKIGALYFPLAVQDELSIGQEIKYLDYKKFPFKKNDVLYSARFNRSLSQNNQYFRVSERFGANQLVWHYPGETRLSNLVARFRDNWGGANCSIHIGVFDRDDDTQVCQDLDGNPVTKPWGVDFNFVNGDIFKLGYRESRLTLAKQAIDQGCDSLQQDNPRLSHGELKHGGCFSDESDREFRDYLLNLSPGINWSSLGVSNPQEFVYSDYLRSLGAPGGFAFGDWSHPKDLKKQFSEFMAIKVTGYYLELKEKLQDYAGYPIPISGNRFDSLKYPFLSNVFDFIMTERPERRASPAEMAFESAFLKTKNLKQVTTLVSEDRDLNRKTMALDYALGNWMIVPDDVYIGPGLPRFRDNPEAYQDITHFVKNNPGLFNGYELEGVYGKIQAKSISRVVYLASRNQTRIHYYNMGEEFPSVQAGAVVKIGNESYTTAGRSTIGFLYLPGDLRQTLSVGDKLRSIQNPDGSGIVFNYILDHGYPVIRKVLKKNINGQVRFILSIFHSDQIRRIEPNAKIILQDGREFPVDSASNVGAVYLGTEYAGQVRAGDKIVSFVNPRKVSYDLRPHTEDAPRITSMAYREAGSASFILRRSGDPGRIQPGTELKILGQSYLTSSGSRVRNYYTSENPFELLGTGDLISEIIHPNGSRDNFLMGSSKETIMASGFDDLVYTLRSSGNQKLIHVVNYGDSGRKGIVFDALKTFGRIPVGFKLHTYDQETVEVPVIQRNSRWWRVDWDMTNLYEVLEPIF